jgi:hypothetical protein
MAAKKHETEVRASRTTVTINETTSAPPIVRASFVVDTKNGVTVGTMYASRSSP